MFTRESTGMLTVGSFDATSRGLSGFSNYSSTFVDILAPGSDGSNGILSTVPTSRSATGYASRAGTSPIQGTSMAAPVVSGAAAMVIGLAESRGFRITPEQVKVFFAKGSIERADMTNYSIRGKVLDLKKLLDAVAEDTGLPISSSLDRSQAAGKVEIASHSKSVGLPSGSSLELKVDKTSDSAVLVNYQWLKDGQVIQGQHNPILVIHNLRPSDKGIYQARLSSGKTQKLTAPIKVNVANCN
jgi:subtilisin family serine protease